MRYHKVYFDHRTGRASWQHLSAEEDCLLYRELVSDGRQFEAVRHDAFFFWDYIVSPAGERVGLDLWDVDWDVAVTSYRLFAEATNVYRVDDIFWRVEFESFTPDAIPDGCGWWGSNILTNDLDCVLLLQDWWEGKLPEQRTQSG